MNSTKVAAELVKLAKSLTAEGKDLSYLLKHLGEGTGFEKLRGIMQSGLHGDWIKKFKSNKKIEKLANDLIDEMSKTEVDLGIK